jgi:hypothetical protein
MSAKTAYTSPFVDPSPPICPHLGLLDDPTTSMLFPSEDNYCRCTGSLFIPSADQQHDFCLTSAFVRCPLQQPEGKHRVSRALIWRPDPATVRARILKVAAAVFTAGLIALAAFSDAPARLTTAIQALAPTATRLVILPTRTPTRTRTAVPSPSPTLTRTLAPYATLPADYTPLPQTILITVNGSTYCRTGTSLAYPRVALFEPGTRLEVIGREASGLYYYVSVPSARNGACWLRNDYTSALGDIASLPLLTLAPSPYPTDTRPPQNTPAPTSAPTTRPTAPPASPRPTATPLPTSPPPTEPPTEPPPTEPPPSATPIPTRPTSPVIPGDGIGN